MNQQYTSLKLVSLALCLLLSTFYRQSQAAPANTTYYVCDCQINSDGNCIAGSDANGGTDPAAPLQSFQHARAVYNSRISAGGELRFCRGGAHDMNGDLDNWWQTENCTAAQPCLIADYTPHWASGDENRPILQRDQDGHGFTFGDHGRQFKNLDMRCTGCTNGNGWAFFVIGDGDDILIDNVSIDGFTLGVHLRGCTATWCTNDRVTIRNSQFTNNSVQGFLGHGNELLIEDSYFENNGDGSVFAHNIYITGDDGITIRNNELYRASLDSNGNCSGVSLVGHGRINNLLIEGNYIHEEVGKANQGCWGISIGPAYLEAEIFNNVTIRGNRIENVGNLSISTSSCISCTIENNVVVQQQTFGTTAIGIRPFGGVNDSTSRNLIIRNNSIATTNGIGIEVDEGSGHTIVSNAIRATAADGAWACLMMPLAASSYDIVDHNLCDYGGGAWASGVGNLASWQAQGWGANSAEINPGFTSHTNLQPDTSSAASIQAGHPTLSSAIDFNGDARPAIPSAGAYDWAWRHLWVPLVMR